MKFISEEETGPSRKKEFHFGFCVDGTVYGNGRGPSKKAAKNNAAKNAFPAIKEAIQKRLIKR